MRSVSFTVAHNPNTDCLNHASMDALHYMGMFSQIAWMHNTYQKFSFENGKLTVTARGEEQVIEQVVSNLVAAGFDDLQVEEG